MEIKIINIISNSLIRIPYKVQTIVLTKNFDYIFNNKFISYSIFYIYIFTHIILSYIYYNIYLLILLCINYIIYNRLNKLIISIYNIYIQISKMYKKFAYSHTIRRDDEINR